MSANKRARLEAATSEAQAGAGDEGEAPAPLHVTRPDLYISAKDAIRLKFGALAFQPEFVHQIFEGESIKHSAADGPPFVIEVNYSLTTHDLFYACNPNHAAAEAALYTLAAALPTPAKDAQALLACASPAADIPGDRLVVCDAETDGACETYCATLADAPAARLAFHERLQSLFRWAIETADPIDTTDERWRLYTVWRRHEGRTELVAACTVFRFQRWVAKEGPRSLLRICQVVVLPPFRGQGHGSRLLHAVYEHAKAEGCLEVTVEDPNAAFRLMRDLTDMRCCLKAALMRPADVSSPPTAPQLAEARKVLPVTDDQLHRCYELQQYLMLQDQLAQLRAKGGPDDEQEAVTKPFRLAIKKRLNKMHKEELDALLSIQAHSDTAGAADGACSAADSGGPSREELMSTRKARLDEIYQEHLAEYAECARRIAKGGSVPTPGT